MKGRHNNFFSVGADGSSVVPTGDPTTTTVVETVTDPGDGTTTVTEEMPSLGSDDTASDDPVPNSEEVTSETETVQPTVINTYLPNPYYPYVVGHSHDYGYGYPTVVANDPTVIVESPSTQKAGVSIIDDSSSDDKRNQTRFLVTWLVMVGLGMLLYRSLAKKI